LNEETLAVMLASDEIFIVTTPDRPTLSTTLKAVKLAKQRGTTINGLILNKVYNKGFEIDLEDIENTIDIPVLAVIPHDINFPKSLSEFTPFTSYKPNSIATMEYKKLAGALIGEKYNLGFSFRNFLNFSPKREEINREIFYDRQFK
jgi:septum site-determining protein MinD